MTLHVSWHSRNRAPQCAPDPAYPFGKDVDMAGKAPACEVRLPVPAECCGIWLLTCDRCGLRVGVTAAGRPDDPALVRVPCKAKGSA